MEFLLIVWDVVTTWPVWLLLLSVLLCATVMFTATRGVRLFISVVDDIFVKRF